MRFIFIYMFYNNLDSSWTELINQELKKNTLKLLFFLKRNIHLKNTSSKVINF